MSNIGRRGALGIGLESTPGTTTTIDLYIPYLSCDLNERHTPIADVAAKGMRDEQGNDSAEGKKWGEGSIEVVLDPATAPYWLAMAIGSMTSSITTNGGTIYYHTIERKADNVPLTATIYRDRVADEIKFPYSVVNSLVLSFADDVAKISVDILSRYPAIEADTPTYVDLELFTFKHAYVVLTNTGVTSTLAIRDFTLNINNNAELKYAPNDNDVDTIVSKNFNVGGSLTVDFESTTQKIAFRDLTKQALSVLFESGTKSITITIPQFRADPLDIATPNDDISQETVNFIAEYDSTTTSTIRVTVVNGVSGY